LVFLRKWRIWRERERERERVGEIYLAAQSKRDRLGEISLATRSKREAVQEDLGRLHHVAADFPKNQHKEIWKIERENQEDELSLVFLRKWKA